MDNSRIKIIANPEGFDIDKLFDIPEIIATETKIICGNLIDSCSESGSEFIEKKKFNIRNIEKCLKNENHRLIFGPRDLNKIKIIPLTSLNLTKNQEINKFINDYNLNISSFNYPKNDILQTLTFQVENIDEFFFSFWNRYNRGIEIGQKLEKINKDSIKGNIIFLRRFIEIFYDIDALNLIITIPLEIHEIYKDYKLNDDGNDEIINSASLNKLYKSFMNFIHKNGALNKDEINKLDKLAYYTIVAFRKMLNNVNVGDTQIDGLLFNLYINDRSNLIETFIAQDSKSVISVLSYGGLNRKLAKNGVKLMKNFYENLKDLATIFNVINSSKEYKDSYLLKTQDTYENFVNTKNTILYNLSYKHHSQVTNVKDTGEEFYKSNLSNTKTKKNKINKALNGGFIFKKPKVLSIDLKKTCSEINKYFKDILMEFLGNKLADNNNLKNNRPGPALTFLLAMTEFFDCDKNNFNTKEEICKNLLIKRGIIANREFDTFSTDLISPLVSDLYRLRYTDDDTYAFVNKSNNIIIQIIGHANNYAQRTTDKHMYKDSLLYGGAVDFYGEVDGEYKSFIVCLDNSKFFNSILEDDFKSKTLLLYDVSLFNITDTNGIVAKKMEPVKRGMFMGAAAIVGKDIRNFKKDKKEEVQVEQEGGVSVLPADITKDLFFFKNNLPKFRKNQSFINDNRVFLIKIKKYFNEQNLEKYNDNVLYKEVKEIYDKYIEEKSKFDEEDIKDEIENNKKKYDEFKDYQQFLKEYIRLFEQAKRKNNKDFLIGFSEYLIDFNNNNDRRPDIDKFNKLSSAVIEELELDDNDNQRKIILPEEDLESNVSPTPPLDISDNNANDGQEIVETDTENEAEKINQTEVDKKTNKPVAYAEDYLTMFHLHNIISLYTNVPDIITAISNIKDKDKQISSQIRLNNSLYDFLISIRKLTPKSHLHYYGSDDQNMYLSTTGIMKVAKFIKEQDVLQQLGKTVDEK